MHNLCPRSGRDFLNTVGGLCSKQLIMPCEGNLFCIKIGQQKLLLPHLKEESGYKERICMIEMFLVYFTTFFRIRELSIIIAGWRGEIGDMKYFGKLGGAHNFWRIKGGAAKTFWGWAAKNYVHSRGGCEHLTITEHFYQPIPPSCNCWQLLYCHACLESVHPHCRAGFKAI